MRLHPFCRHTHHVSVYMFISRIYWYSEIYTEPTKHAAGSPQAARHSRGTSTDKPRSAPFYIYNIYLAQACFRGPVTRNDSVTRMWGAQLPPAPRSGRCVRAGPPAARGVWPQHAPTSPIAALQPPLVGHLQYTQSGASC